MSRNAEVTLAWGDGEYKFRLGIGEVRELQEKTSCGPYFLLGRVDGGQWFIDDLRETIRIGLIGGGLEPVKALALVKRYVDDRPFAESITHARAILLAAIVGAPDGEKPGKAAAARAGRKTPKTSPTGESPLPPGTEPAQS